MLRNSGGKCHHTRVFSDRIRFENATELRTASASYLVWFGIVDKVIFQTPCL